MYPLASFAAVVVKVRAIAAVALSSAPRKRAAVTVLRRGRGQGSAWRLSSGLRSAAALPAAEDDEDQQQWPGDGPDAARHVVEDDRTQGQDGEAEAGAEHQQPWPFERLAGEDRRRERVAGQEEGKRQQEEQAERLDGHERCDQRAEQGQRGGLAQVTVALHRSPFRSKTVIGPFA